MEEKTLKLAIPWLLPGVEDEKDGCLDRLATALLDRRGIQRAHLEPAESGLDLCLHFDPQLVSGESVRRMAKRLGNGIAARYRHRTFLVEGMDCSDCALVLEHSLGRMPGVLTSGVDYASQTLKVEFDTRLTNQRLIQRRVQQLGYAIPASGWIRWYRDHRELVFSILSGLALVVGWTGGWLFGFPAPVRSAFYLAAYGFGGFDIARHTLHHLRLRQLDTHLLMLVAALGAASLGEFGEGALLLFLFSLGHALQEYATGRAEQAVRALANLTPKQALVRRASVESALPVEEVVIGDLVIVRPGERMPVDGEVLAGHSAVDQAPVTGESLPVEKFPGQLVYAGSVNGEGVLEVQATRLSRDSTLARVMQMVRQAQAQKSPTQQLTERFARVYVPAVLGIALLLILVPPLLGAPFDRSFMRAMTLLVAASPCALAISAPSAVLAAVATAARHGVLIKGGAHLENLGRLQVIAFDKTGTLTRGEMQVSEVFSLVSHNQAEVLNIAAAVEIHSNHPIARAVVQEARRLGLEIPAAGQVKVRTGRSVTALVDGQRVWVGSPQAVREWSDTLPPVMRAKLHALEEQGQSVILVGWGERLVGLIGVADIARANARAALEQLKQIGISRTIMLSGDNSRAAEAIASQLGLSDYRAGLLPEDKVAALRELVQAYRFVGMVGDGVNDAPALAHATVGIAMGGAGTDAALETAGVALIGSDLSKLPFAIGLGRATRRIIRQNLLVSLGVIVILAGLAISGLAGIGAAVVFHEGSTLLVAFNALRLLRYR